MSLKALIILGLVVLAMRAARFIRDVRSDAAYLERHHAKRPLILFIARKNLTKEWTGADL